MVFNINDHPGRVAMHCKTPKEAESFCDFLNDLGITWKYGDSYGEITKYHIYKARTCYHFNEGTYCNIEYFVRNGFTVLEWSDYMEDTITIKENSCKGCLYMCDCCSGIFFNCDTCKPFGKNFDRSRNIKCKIFKKLITQKSKPSE